MASAEACVTVNWEICNFSVLLKVEEDRMLMCPNWVVEDTDEKVWGRLAAYHIDSQIKFFVGGFEANRVRFEMSFISSYGVVQLEEDPYEEGFALPKSDLFDANRQSILLNDTMTLCCRMWGKTIKTSEFTISTVLHTLNHLWTIEKLSSSDSHDTYFEQENVKLRVSLKKCGNGAWMGIVEEKQCAQGDLSIEDCAISVKDVCGHVLNHQPNLFFDGEPSTRLFQFNLDSNNTGVTIQMELIVALHGRQELSASSQVVRETPLNPNSPTNNAKHENVSGALGDDLLLLYRDSALSDAILNTEGKSFSAHRSILAARSPVFRAMFEKDETSEVQSGVVDIDDVDSETVDRMLVYLYGDSVGDLEWKEASTLYYAADKYEILPLREKCADFLKACLAADNACDLLVLADRHSDQELMTCVVDFILGHEEVVSSVRWKELEKGNPMLCAKIATQLFLKKGKK